jgi:hypothetical protein
MSTPPQPSVPILPSVQASKPILPPLQGLKPILPTLQPSKPILPLSRPILSPPRVSQPILSQSQVSKQLVPPSQVSKPLLPALQPLKPVLSPAQPIASPISLEPARPLSPKPSQPSQPSQPLIQQSLIQESSRPGVASPGRSRSSQRQDPNKMNIDDLRNFAVRNNLEVGHSGKSGNSIKKDFVDAYNQYYDRIRDQESERSRVIIETAFDTPEFLIAEYDIDMPLFWRGRKSKLEKIIISTRGKQVSPEVTNFILDQFNEIQQKSVQYQFKIDDLLALMNEFRQLHAGSGIETDIL